MASFKHMDSLYHNYLKESADNFKFIDMDDMMQKAVYQDVRNAVAEAVEWAIDNAIDVYELEEKVPEYNQGWCSEIPIETDKHNKIYSESIRNVIDCITDDLFTYYKD